MDSAVTKFIRSLMAEGWLSKRHAAILSFRFGLDEGKTKTLAETAKIFGISRERIRQIEDKMIRRITWRLTKKKFQSYQQELALIEKVRFPKLVNRIRHLLKRVEYYLRAEVAPSKALQHLKMAKKELEEFADQFGPIHRRTQLSTKER